MTTRSVVAKLRLEIGDYVRNAATAVKVTKSMGDAAEDAAKRSTSSQQQQTSLMSRAAESARTNQQAWTTAGTAATAFGAATLAGVGLAIATYAQFDEAMSSVQAATHETTDNMELLREAAIQAGADTAFSATEAAAGIEELAKAGVSTADILGGGLAGALDLAAAGEIGVAEAAETAASAMTQFRLGGESVTHIADLLAAGAGKAQGGVSDLSQALNQSGLVASQMGLSLEETVGSLSMFASAGMVGSDAGTSFRSALLRLANPTKESAGLMEELGLKFYDAQGDFIGMEGVAAQLETRLAGLTQEQRNAALAQLFGQDAIRAASILYTEGADGVAEWTAAVDDSGYAAETARLRMDNLKGDLEALGGSWETLLIRMGESADGPLRFLVQSLDGLIDSLGQLPGWAHTAGLGLGALSGSAALAAGGLLLAVPRYLEFKDALSTLSEISPRASRNIGGLVTVVGRLARFGGALGITAASLGALSRAAYDAGSAHELEDIATAIERIVMYGKDAGSLRLTQIFDELPDLFGLSMLAAEDLSDVIDTVLNPSATDTLSDVFGSAGLPSYAKESQRALEEVDAVLVEMLDRGGEGAGYAREYIEGLALSAEELAQALPGANEALARTGEDALAAAAGLGVATTNADGTALSAEALATSTEAATEALEEWAKTVMDADAAFVDVGDGYQAIIDKNRELAEETAAATESAEDSWEDFYDGTSVSMADWIAEMQRQSEAQASWRDNILAITAQIREQMPADMHAAADGMVDELIAMGPAGAAALATFREASAEEKTALVEAWMGTGTEITDGLATELQAARMPEIPIDADAGPALATAQTFVEGVDELTGTATIAAEPGPARAVLNGVMVDVNASTGIVTIDGTDRPAAEALGNILKEVGLSSADITIDGEPMPANMSLGSLMARVRASRGNVTVGGNNAPGAAALSGLIGAINRSYGYVDVHANTATAYSALNRLVNDQNGRTITVYAQVRTVGQAAVASGGYMGDFARAAQGFANGGAPRRFPNGGYVLGPGTPTSDEIDARLSTTEFVQKAAAVRKYGLTFMHDVNNLRFPTQLARGFADGGSAAPYSPTAVWSAPSVHVSAPSLEGVRISGELDLGNGLTGVINGVLDDRYGSRRQNRQRTGVRG
ncbi:phage tail tape measure protein [Georgenia sp. MJ206]|uniref:phage tail tape measure protein n=1 Tax=Georgenia wangjunii TaxID=3117730 RepID=UPI002F261645